MQTTPSPHALQTLFVSPLRWTEDNRLVTCLLKEIPTFESDESPLSASSKGIKFHDGTTLTAKRTLSTFERMF